MARPLARPTATATSQARTAMPTLDDAKPIPTDLRWVSSRSRRALMTALDSVMPFLDAWLSLSLDPVRSLGTGLVSAN